MKVKGFKVENDGIWIPREELDRLCHLFLKKAGPGTTHDAKSNAHGKYRVFLDLIRLIENNL